MSDATDGSGIESLIRSALENHVDDDAEATDSMWRQFLAAAGGLRDHGGDGVTAVRRLFDAGTARDRTVAACLLGRMGENTAPAVRDLCWPQLEAMLSAEQSGPGDAAVLEALATAFGHLADSRVLPSLLSLAGHPSAEVRFSVTCALPRACEYNATTEAVAALVRLSGDSDSDVRDWACFGLGQLDADGPRVRDALAARLDDPDEDTRCEALCALGATGDARAYDKVAERLSAGGLFKLEIEAAGEVADPRLRPALLQLERDWRDDDDFDVFQHPLEQAIARCDPEQRPAAREFEARLAADLGGAPELAVQGRTVHLDGDYPCTRLIVRDADGRTELNSRIWKYAEPLSCNYEQERDSYLLTLHASNSGGPFAV